ncbi:23S rRNA (guanosine(2251)-2'-O)-methyltransferase RlmB [Woodsholea maritima]|uniref:23S rRNA (guanosine(2251)-2'-O)-methyltransferase RlmB n=1 Tax=Woodsholea maritima TaxID=240237 RepID=UPI00036E54E6|nr:23S rRNA (guanosine(2251)-2'-O)-methyltransferase RlmB [Woodsholea maritima]
MTKPTPRNTSKAPQKQFFAHAPFEPKDGWIWGRHAVLAALKNPRRTCLKLIVSRNSAHDLEPGTPHDMQDPKTISQMLPEGAVHQGFAAKVSAIEPDTLGAVADPTHGVLIVLDQITDPHNVGAIFRSAAAFNVRAIIMQDRKSPPLFGALCKTAVGTCESIAHVRVTNIANTLIELKKAGRQVVGLAGEAETPLHEAIRTCAGPGLVIVMGAEDKGLRPRVAEHCDYLARIPMGPKAESLNVSNAAAITLYEASRYDPRLYGA